MRDTTTNALDLLRSQHEEVDDLIEEIEDADDLEDKLLLFNRLADNLAAHSAIEERLFYPTVMNDDTHGLLIASTEEHLAMKRLVADMLSLEVDDDHFDGKLAVLKETIRHHAHDEEEDKLFPLVEETFDDDELAALGGEMLALFERLMEHAPRRSIPAETAEAAQLIAY